MSSKIKKLQFSQDYLEKRANFLDNLEPSDFRNGESFNLAASIIDQIMQSYHLRIVNQNNPKDFLKKALNNLFRPNSKALNDALELADLKK